MFTALLIIASGVYLGIGTLYGVLGYISLVVQSVERGERPDRIKFAAQAFVVGLLWPVAIFWYD